MNPEKNIGGLYRLKSSVEINEDSYRQNRFCFVIGDFIDNKTPWSDRFQIGDDVLLMLVKSDTDLIMETTSVKSVALPTDLAMSPTPTAAVVWKAAWVMAVAIQSATAAALGSGDYVLAWKQWDEDKRIPGSIFMVPDGKNIWISDIDFKYFEEVEL